MALELANRKKARNRFGEVESRMHRERQRFCCGIVLQPSGRGKTESASGEQHAEEIRGRLV
eukprot:4326789-Pleurochrysis_carterae.AAC.3